MFTDQAHTATQKSWAASKHHPFIQQLQAGTLPLATFRYYLIQDCLLYTSPSPRD